jgi:hypothetical protein
MKAAPVRPALQHDNQFGVTSVQTGRHDGPNILEAFFCDPEPSEAHLGPERGSASNGEQMARREPAPHAAVRQPA